MKKTILFLMILCILFLPSILKAETATLTISSDPNADLFTTPLVFEGKFNVSISGSSWTAIVHLQRSFDNESTWVDVDSFTANIEATVDEPQEGGLLYRIGIKNGNYTSGTLYLRLSK